MKPAEAPEITLCEVGSWVNTGISPDEPSLLNGLSNISVGFDPIQTSSPSENPSPSVSQTAGSVPQRASSPSGSPSISPSRPKKLV